MSLLDTVQDLSKSLGERQNTANKLVDNALDGKTSANKMNADLKSLYNSLKNDKATFAHKSIESLQSTSQEISNSLDKQHKVLLNAKQDIDNKKKQLDNTITQKIKEKTDFAKSEKDTIEKMVNSSIEINKKIESNYNNTIKQSKTNLDAEVNKFNVKVDNVNNSINDFSSFDKILKNAGGVDNLKKELMSVKNTNDLKNVLTKIAKDTKIDNLISNIKNISDVNSITSDLLSFGETQKQLIESQVSGTIDEAKNTVNNITNTVNNSIKDTQNFLNKNVDDWNKANSIVSDLTGGNVSLSTIGINSNLNDLITIDDSVKDLIKENSGLLETIGISSNPFDNIKIGSENSLSSLTSAPTTVASSISSVGITGVNELEPSVDGVGSVAVPAAVEVTDEVKNGDATVASFNGIKIQDSSSDSLGALRAQYWESNNKMAGFIAPWDGRLGTAYTNSQTIGNNMPYGEEWVGSPSLSNPYALIRFDQVSGKNHHKSLIDQRGAFDFRSSRIQPSITLKTLEKENITYQTTTENGKTVVQFDDTTAAKLGLTTSDKVYQDESGALYIDEVDTGTEIWKPAKDGTTATGKTVTEPAEVDVIKNSQGSVDNLVKQAEIQANSKGEAFNKEQKKAEIQASLNEQNKKEGIKDSTVYTPNQAEYWYQKEGWVRCPENGGPYVPRNYCEGDKIKSGTVEEKTSDGTKTEAQSLKEEIKRVGEVVKIQTSRQWSMSGYETNKRYIKSPNSTPVSMKIVEPLTSELVNGENWKGKEQFIYQWSDFLYCSNYGIPNNYLITLRRFPIPVNDAAVVPKQEVSHQHVLPVARAVTWLGEEAGNKISELLAFNTKINWKEMSADVNEVSGNEQGSDSSPFGQGIAKWLGRIDALAGGGKFGQVSGWDEERAKFDPYKDGEYAGRIYGPVNVIYKSMMRDRGLEFNHDIKLNFSYTLKSIGGINPKAALLDVMANFLALTYNNANFWGGANRYFPNKPQYPFLGGERGMKAWYKGDITGFIDGLADQLTSTLKDFGSMLQGLLTNPTEALKKLATGGAKLWMAEKQRDKRPTILAFKGLLTGEPVGEWHLTIGNPFNPIAMIGNLIVEDVNYSFGGGGERLGPDDFPETLNISVTLKHGRPRDKGDIESMFNRGQGRLHYSYYGKEEPWNSTVSTKNIAIMKAATTYEDNFDGKTKSISGKLSMNDYKTVGKETGNPKVATANVLGEASKQSYELAAKVGYKSGS